MKKTTILILILCLSSLMYAQQTSLKDTVNIKEVIISASRWEQEVKSVPARVMGISAMQNELQNQQTSADMLQNSGQIFVQKSQLGGGSAVLRGFEASRIALVVDGVRMNNAIYRLGHLQDIITIDQAMLEKTEVLFGPSSTMYGSDALGGVIHFYTKNPKLNNFGGSAYVRYSSADNEKTGHIHFNVGNSKFASLTSITYSDFGDLIIGNEFDIKYGDWGKCRYYVSHENGVDVVNDNYHPTVMKGSGYKQYDVLEKVLFKQSDKVSHLLNFQLSNNDGNVPRYDRLLLLAGGLPKFAENCYGPQKRIFASYTLDLNGKTFLYDDAKFILSMQDVDQIRINRKLYSNSRISNIENARIYAANFDLTKKLGEKTNIYYGLEYIYNVITSKASSTDMTTGAVTWNKDDNSIATRFADGGNEWSSIALYAQANHDLSKVLSITGGVRVSSVSLSSKYNDATVYPVTNVKSSAMAPSGNLGLVANLPTHTKISILGSTGFRSPNVEDMTAFAPAAGGTARVPNANLKPEYAYNAELNLVQKFGDFFKLEAGAYYSILSNAMVVRDTQYNGSDSVDVNGTMYKAQSIQNADHGNIYGWYLAGKVGFCHGFAFNYSLNGTYGKYTVSKGSADGVSDTIVPMDHIPPMFGLVGFSYKTDKFQAEVFARFSAAKNLADYSPSGEDNLEQTAPMGLDDHGNTKYSGTPSWYTLNLRLSYEFCKGFSVNTGVENILDMHYRQFASGISAPGRNLYLTLRTNF
ncbi:MAG: TonB-dependent receptor [Bacteroidota bacterium]